MAGINIHHLDRSELRLYLQELTTKLGLLESTEALAGETLHEIAEAYQELCQHYGYLSTFYPDTAETKHAKHLVYYGRRLLYGKRLTALRENRTRFFRRVPTSFQAVRKHCLAAAALGVFSALVTAFLVWLNPGLGWHLLSEEAIADLLQGRIWTESVMGMSSLASSQIATNNIGVAFAAFAMGIAGGALTVVLLVINGASLGGIFAVVGHYNMAHRLLDFVVAHGCLELSVIAVAGGCGMYLGDALISPGSLSRREALQQRARPALDVVIFSALCLIPAGIVEGYVSPYPQVPFAVKLSLGLFLGAFYWAYLLFGETEWLRK